MLLSKRVKFIIVAVILSLIAILIYYCGTHGRLVITNKSDDAIWIVPLDQSGATVSPKEVKYGSFVHTGAYAVRNDKDALMRIATITVPSWLGSAKITYNEVKTAKVTRLAALTYENFFPADNSALVSYTDLNGYASGYTTHEPTDAFGGKVSDSTLAIDLTSPVVMNNGSITALTEGSLSRYSFSSNSLTQLLPMETEVPGDTANFPKVRRSSDMQSNQVAVYQGNLKELDIINPDGKVTKTKVPSSGNRNTIFDTNEKGWAVISNTSNSPKSTALKNESEELSYEVNIHTFAHNKNKAISLGSAHSIGAVALSPDGNYIAVTKNDNLYVFETATSRLVMVNPFTNANQLLWNGTKLYSLSTDAGVTVFDTATKQLSPISFNTSGDLSFSKVIPIGSKLYVTAFSAKLSTKLPDGYLIDLDTPSDNITEGLAEKLPINTDRYDISYLGNTIYIRANILGRGGADQTSETKSIRQDAEEHLHDTLPKSLLDRCKVVFVS